MNYRKCNSKRKCLRNIFIYFSQELESDKIYKTIAIYNCLDFCGNEKIREEVVKTKKVEF